jgi:hydroxymethylglutaryl-CoA reductase
MNDSFINGFSRYTKQERIHALIHKYEMDKNLEQWLAMFACSDAKTQKIIEELSENTLTSFHLPYSVAPNFVVNGKSMFFPLVSEESSVVAALANAAGFWAPHGGFHARVVGTEKKGQVHFTWKGDPAKLQLLFPEIKDRLLLESSYLTQKMTARGGGITSIELKEMTPILPNYYQLDASFDTCDAMGANFINSCLEQFAHTLRHYIATSERLSEEEHECSIIMAILSNYTPQSLVRAWVECPVEELLRGKTKEESEDFAETFVQAIQIAKADVSRAVTHNKGIFNGIDALAIATGNDFRALEACAHAYASRKGQYSSLTDVEISNGKFHFSIELPLAVGVVGGVTALHPLARLSMRILDNPSASELMMYLAVAGLACNFAAIRALISGGIQKGHMKMHLSNIMNHLNVPLDKQEEIENYFADKPISFSSVEQYLNEHFS